MKEAHVAYLQILIEWNDKVLLIKGLIILASGSWRNVTVQTRKIKK